MSVRPGVATRWSSALSTIILVGMVRTAAAGSFAGAFGPVTRPLGKALSQSIARSSPVISASPGFVYRFDMETGIYERESTIFGLLFLERPDPVGRGNWNVSLSYQRMKIDTFEGQDIDKLRDAGPPIIDPDTGALFTIPLFDIHLTTHQFTPSVTYGISNNADLNVTLPVLYSDFTLRTRFRGVDSSVPCERQPCRAADGKVGVGDLLLRGKYRLVQRDWARAAAALTLRLPTGDEDSFQGTGSTEIAPMLYAASRWFPVGQHMRCQGVVNGGVNFSADDVDDSNARWGVGADCSLAGRAALGLAILGRHAFSPIAPPGAFDVDRCLKTEAGSCTQRSQAPLFGIENERPDYYDLSVGGRLNVWRDTIIAFGNVIVPLNDDGFRSEVIPLVGLEATF